MYKAQEKHNSEYNNPNKLKFLCRKCHKNIKRSLKFAI